MRPAPGIQAIFWCMASTTSVTPVVASMTSRFNPRRSDNANPLSPKRMEPFHIDTCYLPSACHLFQLDYLLNKKEIIRMNPVGHLQLRLLGMGRLQNPGAHADSALAVDEGRAWTRHGRFQLRLLLGQILLYC